ncbi:MAG: Isoleucine-tRNA ligase, partial [Candidatus Moranbacteria bacterium GW2011_GWF2_35_54]
YDKGKIYEGEKVLMYCTRCATPISKAEVAMDNSYKVVTDPSVFVKFQLEGEENTYLLAWTTTPWTLSANVALAINKNLKYVVVEAQADSEKAKKGDKIVFAFYPSVLFNVFGKDFKEKHNSNDDLLNVADFYETKDGELFKYIEFKEGLELVNKKYKPLFENYGENAHRVIGADFVTTEDGTGIVHIAPAFGEDDYAMSKKGKWKLYWRKMGG